MAVHWKHRAVTWTVALGLAASAGGVQAQAYPAKQIRILVGFAPGGSTDIVARLIAQEMTKGIGQQVVVDNRPGAGSDGWRTMM